MEKILKITNQILVVNFFILLMGLSFAGTKGRTSSLSSQKPQEKIKEISKVLGTLLSTPTPSTPISEHSKESEKASISPEPTNNNSQPDRDLSNEIGIHNNPSDCWIVINGRYYDITSYFGKHPGGDGVLSAYCGRDASNAFATKNKNPPVPHSANAELLLQEFLIQ